MPHDPLPPVPETTWRDFSLMEQLGFIWAALCFLCLLLLLAVTIFDVDVSWLSANGL